MYEGVVRWMKGQGEGGEGRGSGLLGKVRFPLMEGGMTRERGKGEGGRNRVREKDNHREREGRRDKERGTSIA